MNYQEKILLIKKTLEDISLNPSDKEQRMLLFNRLSKECGLVNPSLMSIKSLLTIKETFHDKSFEFKQFVMTTLTMHETIFPELKTIDLL